MYTKRRYFLKNLACPFEVACNAGVFHVFTNKAQPSRFAAMLVYKMWAGRGWGRKKKKTRSVTPTPLGAFSSLPNPFRVRAQDGARLITVRSVAKIRLHCRLLLRGRNIFPVCLFVFFLFVFIVTFFLPLFALFFELLSILCIVKN